ncbi:MAG TPA: hypothetical protein VMC41_02665 [Candidatus Nanoarchaeia archaeon]|nr:hypothetical protein [Candidatus Nanoarchaeia archaeon]
MVSEKNDSMALAKIKTAAVKRRIAQSKAEPEKEAEKPPKKSKLAVRVIGREFKLKDEPMSEVGEDKGETALKISEPEKKANKDKKSGKDFFHRASHRISETDAEAVRRQGKDKKKIGREITSRPVGMYRKISIFFIILTLALLAAAFYFFLVSLTVEVTPKTERISDMLNITVTNAASSTSAANLSDAANILGAVERIPVRAQKIYQATGANILGEQVTGRVTLINNYNQDQTLVATTRLLTPDGKLFRIKNKVNVPSGGTAEADIYTDQPSPDMAIGPSTFTIPGLRAGLQDKIYAKSAAAFVYQSDVQKFVQNIDIEKAIQDINKSLVSQVNSQFTDNYRGYDKVIVQVDKDSLAASSSVKAGDKADSFNLELSADVEVVAFHSADVKKLAEDRLISVVPVGEKFAGLDEGQIQYNLISGDYKSGTATLEVPIAGSMVLSDIDNAVDKTKLAGLNAAQINQYLTSLDKFSDIKLIFVPPFIDKAPNLVDRIRIVVK